MSFTLIVYGEYGVMFTLNFTLNIMVVFAIVYTCCVCWLVDIVMRYVVQVVLVVHPMAAFHCCEFFVSMVCVCFGIFGCNCNGGVAVLRSLVRMHMSLHRSNCNAIAKQLRCINMRMSCLCSC